VQSLVGGNSALSVSPPLTSDLWALGVLLCFLFLGCSLFDTAHYVNVASDGFAVPTSDMEVFQRPAPVGEPSLPTSSRTVLNSFQGSVIGRLFSGVSGVFGKTFKGSGAINDNNLSGALSGQPNVALSHVESIGVQLCRTNSQHALSRAAIIDALCNPTKSKFEARPLEDRTTKLIQATQTKVEFMESIPEIVDAQIELLAAVGASSGARLQWCVNLLPPCTA
jgi:hypothetical protein